MGEFQLAVLRWQGFLLIAAAAAKVRAPRRFAGYRLAASALVKPLAWSVPGVEVILGAGLISGWHALGLQVLWRATGVLARVDRALDEITSRPPSNVRVLGGLNGTSLCLDQRV